METKKEQIDSLRTNIDKLRGECDELYRKLDKALLIQELWPDAFDNGPVTTVVKGNPHSGFIMSFKFTDGADCVMDLKLVPFKLWPASVIADIERVGPRGPYYRKLQENRKRG